MSATRALLRLAATAALAALAVSAVAALLVWALALPQQARRLLDLTFTGPVRDPGAALEIAATNLRLAGAGLVGAWAIGRRPQLRLALDTTLGLLAVLNAAAVGIALGAYGPRLLEVLAPHGPLELAAFALAGAAYLSARRGPLTAPKLAAVSIAAIALLLTASLLETYVPLGGNR